MTTLPLRTLVLALCLPLASAAADTLHVDANLTTGLDDGTTWADAFQGSGGLQTALAAATSGDEIFVAAGTYLPTSTGSRTVAFALKNGVTIWGSFAGDEASPAERPPFGTADSVLDGDLAGNDGSSLFGDNSFHVITTVGTNTTAVIDGFVVRGGAATTGGANRDRGAGILCLGNVSPTIRNCRFLENRCTFGGAAGYVNNGGAPEFTDCTFEDGVGGSFGGAFDIAGGGAVLFERCLFRGNTAARAGALEIFATNGVLVNNCVFRDNVATGSGGGGAIWMGNGGNTRIRNCTVVSNSSLVNFAAGLFNQSAGGATVHNSIFWDNEGPGGVQFSSNQANPTFDINYCIVEGGFTGGGVGNLSGDPAFADVLTGDYSLTPGSAAIDAGNTPQVPVGTLLDFAGGSRLVDDPSVADTGVGPAPVVDIGAFEFVPSPFLDLGNGLAGSAGTPVLVMSGPLSGGSTLDVSLSDALGNTTAYLVVGFTQVNAAFKGGTLVPEVDLLVTLPTSVGGTIDFSATVPVGAPAGFVTFYQYWIVDGAGPVGFSASNAIQSTTP